MYWYVVTQSLMSSSINMEAEVMKKHPFEVYNKDFMERCGWGIIYMKEITEQEYNLFLGK